MRLANQRQLLATVLFWLLIWVSLPAAAFAEPDLTTLAKEEQNPISTTMQLGFKYFSYSGAGIHGDENPGLLNFYLSLPNKLNDNWNLITQANMPFLSWQYGSQRYSGAGNLQLQMYFSPRKSKTIWGVGPAFQLPTAANPVFDNGQFAAGPVFALVNSHGRWVNAIQGSHLWKMGGSNDKPAVNTSNIQTAINYNFKSGWALSLSAGISVDWAIQQGERSLVPIGLALSHTKVPLRGGHPMTWSIGISYNLIRPDSSPRMQYRFQITHIFPQRTADTVRRHKG